MLIHLSSLFFALMGMVVKLLAQRLPAEEVALVRTLLPALFLTPAMIADFRARGPALRSEVPLLLLRGLFGAISLVCYFKAISLIDYSNAALLAYTSPLFTAMLAALFLDEPLTRRVVLAMPVVLFGVVLVLRPTALFGGRLPSAFLIGSSLGLLTGMTSAVAYTSVRRLAGRCSNATIVGAFGWVGTLICVPLAWRSFVSPLPVEWLGLGLVAVLATIGQLLMTAGYKRYPAAHASTMGVSVVVFACILSWLLLREVPTLIDAAGLAITLTGLVLLQGPEIKSVAEEEALVE